MPKYLMPVLYLECCRYAFKGSLNPFIRNIRVNYHTVATGQISVIFRVLKIWVWKTYLTKVIEYNLILYTILEVAQFLRIVYKSSHKKLFSISNHNFKHRYRITWNWQLFNHFCLPHFGLRQITNTLEMTHRVSQCWWPVPPALLTGE